MEYFAASPEAGSVPVAAASVPVTLEPLELETAPLVASSMAFE